MGTVRGGRSRYSRGPAHGQEAATAQSATIYRFDIELSDSERGRYETLELRVARHPSESDAFLLTRVIAYALEVDEGIELTAGLCVPGEPAIRVVDPTGQVIRWIEVGNPSAQQLARATSVCDDVRVYTYKDPRRVAREVATKGPSRLRRVALFSLGADFLAPLEAIVARRNRWSLVHSGGELFVTAGEAVVQGTLLRTVLEPPG